MRDINFIPEESINEVEERWKQEIADSMDVTPGLSESCSGLTWAEIFKMCGYKH